MTTFAIVIPNLNQSHFLPTALESLRFQSAKFSLALMDGGSTDDFQRAADLYSDIITFLRSAPDGGQAAAIQEGTAQIAGDIVSWLNADDYYFPNALEKVASCFENDPELDVVYGNAVHVNPEGFFLSYFPPVQEFDPGEITKNCFICQPACFVRRSAYERVGGINPGLQYTMDWDLWCRLSASGAKFHYLPEMLAAVRYYHGTKTLSGDKRRYREIYRIEKTHGKRLLRISALGGWYYSLTFKKNRTYAEHLFFILFDLMTKLKKAYHRVLEPSDPSNLLLYGFHRWQPIVEGKCIIQIPWYDKREWHRLRLKVEPPAEQYEIIINGHHCDHIFFDNGYLISAVPELQSPYRKVGISHCQNHRWKLAEFICDLNDLSESPAAN
jgi:glycosyltransferase involved in cell wall biosynthesis